MMAGLRLYAALGVGLVLAALLGWALRLDVLRGRWQGKYRLLSAQAGKVLTATRTASDNPALVWGDVAVQVELIDRARRQWSDVANLQSTRIDALGIETARLKALSAEARTRADAIIAKRDAAIVRLSNAAIARGDRADCVVQLRDAEAALDLVYAEGL